jgi:hypothetical protein
MPVHVKSFTSHLSAVNKMWGAITHHKPKQDEKVKTSEQQKV